MDSQKYENLLNASLDSTLDERKSSDVLRTGYDFAKDTWEVIVRFQGDLSFPSSWDITVTRLLGNYAILIVPERYIEKLSEIPEIVYVEKPKRLFFATYEGRLSSCVFPLQQGKVPDSPEPSLANGPVDDASLFGNGILVACIDSGVDIRHPDFRFADGSTRFVSYWDQTLDTGTPPDGYQIGSAFSSEMINAILSEEPPRLAPSPDQTGHGTAVMGIAAGNGRASDGVYRGVAPASQLIAVKLGSPDATDFPRTTQLMQALDYVVRTALQLGLPVAVNISFGNNYGSHSGDSLLETYINTLSNYGRNVICIGAGNEGSSGLHAEGVLSSTSGNFSADNSSGISTSAASQTQEFSVGPYQTSMSIQLWKSYPDDFDIYLRSPSKTAIGPIRPEYGTQRIQTPDANLLIYYGEPSPYASSQEIFFDFLPVGATNQTPAYLSSGLWQIRLVPRRIVFGEYHLWMPGGASLGVDTRFLTPSTNTTLTIPSTAFTGITVGAYDSRSGAYADFSGRGYTRILRTVKPDLVAPGVAVTAPRPDGGYGSFTGTSFAAPFVTGSAALLMEWGIGRRHDPYLYGEKVKAYLQKGARKLPGLEEYPNNRTGWGALCLRNSLPM